MAGRLVTADCERPARMDGTCFYCGQPVGGQHTEECVCYTKRIMIRAVVEYEIEVPHSWGKEQVEFQRNEGSWCADNMIDELNNLGTDDDCLCSCVVFEYLGDVK